MPEFRCRLADASGQIINVSYHAATESELRHRLSEQGYFVYAIQERGKGLSLSLDLRTRKKRVKGSEFLIFNQQFLALIRAGLPILKALELLSQRVKNPDFQSILGDVANRVKSGALLSEAFEEQGIFSKVYTASILAGEKSGGLEQTIQRYIEYQKILDGTRARIRNALTYPTILTVMLIVLVSFLMTYVVPQFAEFYGGLGAELPTVTTVLIAVSLSIRNQLMTGVIVMLAAIIGLRLWARSHRGGRAIDRLKLKLPLVGEVWNKFAFSQLSRTLSTLLAGGIPLVSSLEIVSESSGNRLITEAMKSSITSIRQGQSLSRSFESHAVVPDLAVEMVQVGESTGSLSEMLKHVADFYDEEVNVRLNQLFTFVEPILLVILAIIVSFVLIALYLPIFNLAGTIRA
ncbi:MAG: type II secretion system F family protein [Acidobacteriota bacterium]